MNNKEFDDIIKEKLDSLNTNGSEDAWDLFKEKWDSENDLTDSDELSSEDQDLDAKIKTNMQKLRIPFNSKHWIILKEQLELEALFKKKLYVAKSVELVILAFLVLGILNLWPIQNEIHYIQTFDNPMVASIPVDKETAEKFEAQEEVRLAYNKEVNLKIYKSTKKFVQQTILSGEVITSDTESRPSSKKLLNKEIKTINAIPNPLEKALNSYPFEIPFLNNSKEESRDVNSLDPLEEQNKNTPIALLLPSNLDQLELPLRPLGFPDITLDKNAFDQKENTYVSIAVGPKMNLVNSPFDPIYEIDPYNIINTNFNISGKIIKQIGNIELYTGVGYTNTSYVPKLPKLQGELYTTQEEKLNHTALENIKFKMLNIPIGVRYNIIDSDQYQFYTSAGIDLNIIAESEFTFKDDEVGRSNFHELSPKPTNPDKNEIVNTNAKLSQKEFKEGIRDGGMLKDNLYATASIGLGFNWKTSSHTGIFIEPRYSHFVSSKGIGPNTDKVHNISIDLGFKYQLD